MEMLYPTFEIVEGIGLIPNIYLPDNFKELVPKFYEQGRKEEIEKYKSGLEKILKSPTSETEIILNWDNTLGLKNIKVGIHGGLDLNDSILTHFEAHNLSTKTSMVAGSIAMKYISELLKSE